ncbi:YlzJ-like family protein [Virgibacillus halophilus]|uniref:YlzJ-like family protein n=1 Tax=Tigheibacillus halophilus TaxID=361280 RepID=A0ABU5CBK5_9BACI|nr:YlzJ-like family protein [Virgibacillus halophilus]
MILYTPLSEAEIFPCSDDDFKKRECVNYKNKSMYVERRPDGTYQLLQLLSSDPNDFLKK